jgi:predicted phage terminase large subunit-like protein
MSEEKRESNTLDAGVIEAFVDLYLRKNFDDPSETAPFHREWWDMATSPHKFVAIAAPRGHSKSTSLTFAYTMACVLFRERKFVLLVSDTETQAAFFLGNIKKEFETNDNLRRDFGIKGLSKATESDVILDFEDGKQARIVAKGSEQKLRGLNWNGTRPDLILCDDMENDEIVLNKDRRTKFKRWFVGALLPSRSKNGIVRIVGTILHMDSLLESYMPKKSTTRFPMDVSELRVRSSINEHFYAAKYKAHPSINDFSKTLWPAYKNSEWLRQEQAKYKADGLGDVYAQEFLNEPIDESNSLFSKADFIPLKDEDLQKPLNYYVSMDLAVTQKTVSDWSVFVVAGQDSDGRLQVRDVIRARLNALEIVDKILEIAKKYLPEFMVVEKGTIANSILPALKMKMQEQNFYVPLHLIASVVDKVQRSGSIRARMRAGQVKFNKDAPWFDTLQQEALRFPRDRYDDQVDALSLLGQALNKYANAPTKEQIDEDDYNDMLKQQTEFSFFGRSEVTGY